MTRWPTLLGSAPILAALAARAYHDGWTVIVRQISQGRDQPPVSLRSWGRVDRVPEDEASCLALWELWAGQRGVT